MTGTGDCFRGDWTVKDGRSNSSDEFLRLCSAVESIIRNEAHALIGGRADTVARTVMAHLAHKYGVGPQPSDVLASCVRLVLEDADTSHYQRTHDDWWLLRLRRALAEHDAGAVKNNDGDVRPDDGDRGHAG